MMASLNIALFGSIALGGVIFILVRLLARTAHHPVPHPPGPPGMPLIGHLRTAPHPAWQTYRDWGIQYSTSDITPNALQLTNRRILT